MAKRRRKKDEGQGDFLDGFSRPREAMARRGDPETAFSAPLEESVEKQRWIALETFARYDRAEGMHSEEGLFFAVKDHPGINLEFFHKRQSELWKDFVVCLIYPVHDSYGMPLKRLTSHSRDAFAFRITPEGAEALKRREWPERDPERDKNRRNKKKNNGDGVEVKLKM